MKMKLLKSVAVAMILFALYVLALAAYLTLEFIKSQPTVEMKGNGRSNKEKCPQDLYEDIFLTKV